MNDTSPKPLNPLLSNDKLPLFDQIKPEHIGPAMQTLIAQAEDALAKVTQADFPADWHQVSLTLDTQVEQLSRAWGAVNHLNSVADNEAFRHAYNAALPQVSSFYTALGASDALFAKYRAMDANALHPHQQRALTLTLRSFELGGAQLTGANKARFTAISDELAQLSQKFSEHVLDATDGFAYFATEDEIEGIPDDVLHTAKTLAQADGQPERYKLTLKMPCYLPVMQYAKSSALREILYRAYVTRASDQSSANPAHDNATVMDAIIALRQEEAQLLGFANYAELSLVPKMAQSPNQVIEFLRDLGKRAKPYAEQDLQEMRNFASQTLGWANPQAWDWTYIGERLKEAKYAFSETEVKQYFPLPKVLEGLFHIIQNLFDVQIRPDQAPVWHADVQFYRIERSGVLIGQFYLDTAARDGKRGGAWMDDVRGRWLRPDTGLLQTPVAHLVCNFAAGVDGKPALLTHDDVITLFHEFGHGLHHLLTQVNERDVAGISGVEWDAVELPSQFMENFCWEWYVLSTMTAHVDTGKPLPRELFDKMIAAKNFQSGLQTVRQVEFALFDMLLHTTHPLGKALQDLANAVRQEVAVIPVPAYNRSSHTFGHIFAGGYAAGYYSYKWAEVLSSDAYAALEESADANGRPNPAVGKAYLTEILQVGGSRPAAESFKAFRGRAPQIDALLRHQGMINTMETAA